MDNDAYYYYLLLAIFSLVYFMRIYRGSLTSRNGGLRLPPGPWQLPIIGSLHHLLGALPHRALRDLSRRHGPLMLLRFGEVPAIVASTAEASKEITKTYDHIFCTRPLSASAKVLSEHGKGIAFAPYGGEWRQLRKICILELLGARNITSFRPIHEEEVNRLIRSIVDDSSEQDARHIRDARDGALPCIMGGRFTEHDTLLHYVDEAVEVVGGFTLPDLFPSSRLVRALSGTLHRAEVFRDSVLAFIGRVIDEHVDRRSSEEAQAHQEQDIIDVLLRIQKDGNLQFPLTMDNLKVVIFFIPFGAGRRICPGMLFGVAIAELALASLLFHFDWTLPDGTSPADLDMTETMGITARKKEDLQLRAALHLQPAET
ncbi:hypothetical protein VPH35_121319 [Triticum aestivum]